MMIVDKLKIFTVAMLFPLTVSAADFSLSFELKDKKGKVFEDAVVSLMPADRTLIPAPDTQSTTEMEQKDKQFTPHILVVQKGQSVSFPNRDDIQHHVFSFSETKSFELELYKEDVPSPLVFEDAGDVELGCSVHGWMLGYIKVVETPYFSKTDDAGRVTIELPEGQYTLSVWHPRIVNNENGVSIPVNLSNNTSLSHQLKDDVLPPLLGFDSFEQDADYQ
jgi:plastocyanin